MDEILRSLDKLYELSKEYNALHGRWMRMRPESHRNGRGTAHHLAFTDVDVQLGTLSKACLCYAGLCGGA